MCRVLKFASESAGLHSCLIPVSFLRPLPEATVSRGNPHPQVFALRLLTSTRARTSLCRRLVGNINRDTLRGGGCWALCVPRRGPR